MDSRDGFCLKICTSGDSWCLFANSAGWLKRVSRVIRWVAMEYIAPDAPNKCWERPLRVSSSINLIRAARSRSSGSSAVVESFLNLCKTVLIGLALLSRGSTSCLVKTLSLYSARAARLE